MNNLQSNERHLADKLRQAPTPDVNRNWEQMRELLDREMPEAVAGGWAGNKRWWWMGITAALMMAAIWLTQELNQREQKAVAVKTPTESNTPAIKTNETTANDVASSQGSMQDDKVAANKDEVKAVTTGEQNDEIPNDEKNVVENKVAVNKAITLPKSITSQKATTSQTNTKNKSYITKNNNKPVKQQELNISNPGISKNDGNTTAPEKFDVSSDLLPESTREANGININKTIANRKAIHAANEFDKINTSASDAIAVSGKTDKAYLKQLRKKMIKEDNRRMSRSGMSGNFGNDGREITFAAGITIPQSFALGQQQSSPYSVSGKTSRFADYLPAPFFQYHINNKLFLQTEFHFQSPQYTNRLLLATSSTQSSTNTRFEKNVYLEKLYYFNIPLNVYYTPARNFSIGSGLQYSSLLSGVASFEERRVDGQTTSSYQSVTRRFKDDSVAAKFAPSEWRYQFDANYYLKRFTLGLRYNQALKDFVNLQIPGLPATQDRNKSFLLYLRYNIWEERKKD